MSDTLPGYDEIPYESFPITETHPDRLAVIGRLFGLAAPDPARSRILELGCAAGGNLLPIAFHLPDTRCTGVELSRAQALEGAETSRALGLDNAEIRHQDILQVPLAGEPFDYIVAHGVFSWVPTAVQEHILALCGARLAPGGIAYVSYNALPGGRQRSMLRDMLLHHVRDITSPRERLAGAREMLAFLATPLRDTPPGHDWLRKELERLQAARDSYLYHEYLEETNEPVLFRQFVDRAAAHGLQYLADTRLHTMFPSTLGADAEASLARFDDLTVAEQYADFLTLRPFRRSLLCRSSEPLTREIDLDPLFALPLYTDLAPDQEGVFRNAAGRSFRVEPPLLRAVIESLSEAFPRARLLEEIMPEASERAARSGHAPTSGDLRSLPEQLFSLFASAGLQVTLCPPDPVISAMPAGSGPRATDLARTLAERGERLIPTARHQSLQLDPVSTRILARLDGSREPAALVEDLIAAAARDPELTRELGAATPDRQRERLEARVSGLLALLERHGLLVALR
ncbi:methyltransferase regulatory domain-containing protein [Thioalkalivibrio sp.]|uniref:methyltransferase regulatory domain-containing protein n=1 Tax=Thioalkalivibrio sp. TaxID=2093813 RepID=UPI003564506F